MSTDVIYGLYDANTLASDIVNVMEESAVFDSIEFCRYNINDIDFLTGVLIDKLTKSLDNFLFTPVLENESTFSVNIDFNFYVDIYSNDMESVIEMEKHIKKNLHNCFEQNKYDVELSKNKKTHVSIITKKTGLIRKKYNLFLQILVT